ncbi:MAG: hypothetical protein ACOVT5_11840, partial [Armatimonadaceae bacterium]
TRLQLLGPLTHQGPAAADAYLARPKQAALLAYLACAGAGAGRPVSPRLGLIYGRIHVAPFA